MLPVFGTGKKKLLYIKYNFHKFPQTTLCDFAAARFKMRLCVCETNHVVRL